MHDEALTPEPIMKALSAFWLSGALKAALDLNVFGALASAPLDAGTLGERINAPARSTALLADALVATGFLSKQQGRYGLAPVSETFLDPSKPSFFGGMANIVTSPMLWDGFQDLAAAVRNDGTVMEQHPMLPDNLFWHTFAQASLGLAAGQGRALAEVLTAKKLTITRILDVAAGTGGYGYSVAACFPQSRVTFADWPGVLEYTKGYASRFGVQGRAEFAPGDIFSADWGSGYDLVLLPNIFHHFDEADCVALSRRVRDALKPGGMTAVIDFMPDEARAEEVLPLLFGLVMLVMTPKGTVYTEGDYRRILGRAGFTRFEGSELPGPDKALLAW